MKKALLSILGFSILSIGIQITLTSSSNGRAFSANSGNTGAPGETTTCRSCHGSGFSTTVSIVIKDTLGNPISAYVPGSVYTAEFTVNAVGASRYGFQLVTLNGSNSPVNGFSSPATNTRLVTLGNGRQYAEHAGKSVTNTFSTVWTAPAIGTGTITFFGGGAAVNNNGNTSGDGGNITSLSLTESISVGFTESKLEDKIMVYPNPSRNVVNFKNLSSSDKVNYFAELFSISGQIVHHQEIGSNDNSKSIDVSNFENGYYILRISNGTDSFEEKILIQR